MKLTLCMTAASAALSTLAANPVVTAHADPHMRVWNGRMYFAAGCDDSIGLRRFRMIHWDIYSSDDLITWRHETKIDPADTFIGADSEHCWAPDLESRNGKYYFYFSHRNKETGVLVADAPGGPYKDVLGKPMIPESFSENLEYDPTVFTDDDGTPYLIWGRDGDLNGTMVRYQIAKLNEDMTSLADEPRDLKHERPNGFMGKPHATDGSHIHKHKDLYYLSCHGGMYMTSSNIYGPYTNPRKLSMNGHSSYCEFNGQTYVMYENGMIPYGNRLHRQCVLTYLHYKDNGDMVVDPNFEQGPADNKGRPGRYYHEGVGNYDAAWEKIEAEWFFKKEGLLEKRECPAGGFELQGIQNGDSLLFPNTAWMNANSKIELSVSAKQSATIEVREQTPKGKLLGTIQVEPTGSWDRYQTVGATLNNKRGTNALCFVFKGPAGDLVHLDWFRLK